MSMNSRYRIKTNWFLGLAIFVVVFLASGIAVMNIGSFSRRSHRMRVLETRYCWFQGMRETESDARSLQKSTVEKCGDDVYYDITTVGNGFISVRRIQIFKFAK
jgi:hypothetical protein